jgi:hypothetical protein
VLICLEGVVVDKIMRIIIIMKCALHACYRQATQRL